MRCDAPCLRDAPAPRFAACSVSLVQPRGARSEKPRPRKQHRDRRMTRRSRAALELAQGRTSSIAWRPLRRVCLLGCRCRWFWTLGGTGGARRSRGGSQAHSVAHGPAHTQRRPRSVSDVSNFPCAEGRNGGKPALCGGVCEPWSRSESARKVRLPNCPPRRTGSDRRHGNRAGSFGRRRIPVGCATQSFSCRFVEHRDGWFNSHLRAILSSVASRRSCLLASAARRRLAASKETVRAEARIRGATCRMPCALDAKRVKSKVWVREGQRRTAGKDIALLRRPERKHRLASVGYFFLSSRVRPSSRVASSRVEASELSVRMSSLCPGLRGLPRTKL